jgi:hypothetical protein
MPCFQNSNDELPASHEPCSLEKSPNPQFPLHNARGGWSSPSSPALPSEYAGGVEMERPAASSTMARLRAVGEFRLVGRARPCGTTPGEGVL